MKKKVFFYIVTAILPILLYPLLRGFEWQGSTTLHTVMETVATLLALFVGTLSLIHYYTNKKDQLYLFIGTGFFGTAFLDGYHTVVTSAFFFDIFPSVPESLIPWSWIASRLFLSVFFFWSYAHFKYANNNPINEKKLYIVISLITLMTFLFFAFTPLPIAYYPELFFHRPEELIPAIFFALALYGYLKKGIWKDNSFEFWLILSLIVGLVSQVVFMSFSAQLFDMQFDIAHLLKKVSYIFVLTGLLISIYKLVLNERRQTIRNVAQMGEMISMIAHQWRQPISAISMDANNMTLDIALDNLDNDTAEKYANSINEQTQHLSKTIDDFRNFYKPNKKVVVVKLEEVISKSLNIIKASLINDNIKIIEEYNSKEDIELYDNELIQVILNILKNAKDNFKEKQTKNPYIKIITENRKISIYDNGGGIPEDIVKKIFDPYFSTKNEKNGTGLGLYMSKMIVEEHHKGKLSVQNTDGGVCFMVELEIVEFANIDT